MHVEGFVLALEEVADDHGHREVLGRREWSRIAVDIGADEEEEGVDEDGSEVFEDEDCNPGHLWTYHSVLVLSLYDERIDIPRSFTIISLLAEISGCVKTNCLRSFKIFFVSGPKRPIRSGSHLPALATAFLTSWAVVFSLTSMVEGRFLMGFLGSMFV